MRKFLFCALSSLLVASCNSPVKDESEVVSDSVVTVANPVTPKSEPLSATGNDPYVVEGRVYTPQLALDRFTQQGKASWYGRKFHGKKTSSGEIYNMYELTAAHKTLPIPSYITVTNLANNKSLVVRVNDRGPFVGTRILDLSYAAARELGFVNQGTTQIKLESITKIEGPVNAQDGNGLVYLQTGVFSEHQNAMQAKLRLESQGYQVKVDETDESLYKVKVGPFSTANLAYAKKLVLEEKLRQPVMLVTEKQ